jgi:hypothetical protein
VVIPVLLRPRVACGPGISSERASIWEASKQLETHSLYDRQSFFQFHNRHQMGFDVREYVIRYRG